MHKTSNTQFKNNKKLQNKKYLQIMREVFLDYFTRYSAWAGWGSSQHTGLRANDLCLAGAAFKAPASGSLCHSGTPSLTINTTGTSGIQWIRQPLFAGVNNFYLTFTHKTSNTQFKNNKKLQNKNYLQTMREVFLDYFTRYSARAYSKI